MLSKPSVGFKDLFWFVRPCWPILNLPKIGLIRLPNISKGTVSLDHQELLFFVKVLLPRVEGNGLLAPKRGERVTSMA